MIASYLHNFIFIKTRKTAGTTVELTLAPLCGPDDIITPLGANEEELRGNGQPLCRNFMDDPGLEGKLIKLLMNSEPSNRRRRQNLIARSTYFQHSSAAEARQNLDAEFWERAHKFTVERHPYERVVSKAYFKYKGEEPFERYLDGVIRAGHYQNYKFYTIDGRVAVDEILRQENLYDDMKRLGERLGVKIPDELPRGKGNHRTDRRPAREILTNEQKRTIYEKCMVEFELMGYEP